MAFGLATIILNLKSLVIPYKLRFNNGRRRRVQSSTYHTPRHLPGEYIDDERAARNLLDWLRSILKRNPDLIQTVAWLPKTDEGSSQLKQITNYTTRPKSYQTWLNMTTA
ncbi:hypothetical protein PGTUg99_029414 [Puccinia graminis f. sp. tritici]|uniref:Uncharacterized protein n=1 Tax=Puccinia graminis f. sp. tritici TaxID=56615 RepID=A0A5B0NJR4_PUCGR|nr:hypothetical protein PGTUg99_029414 [Puccinia graminis f. sp. tritici]